MNKLELLQSLYLSGKRLYNNLSDANFNERLPDTEIVEILYWEEKVAHLLSNSMFLNRWKEIGDYPLLTVKNNITHGTKLDLMSSKSVDYWLSYFAAQLSYLKYIIERQEKK